MKHRPTPNIASGEISAGELWSWFESAVPMFLLDVREPEERQISNLIDSASIPYGEIRQQLHDIESAARGRTTVVYCRNGIRSRTVADLLVGLGISNVCYLTGGINAYAKEIDSSMTPY